MLDRGIVELVMGRDARCGRSNRQGQFEGRQAFRRPKMPVIMDDFQEALVQVMIRRCVVEGAIGDTVEEREVSGGVFLGGRFSRLEY